MTSRKQNVLNWLRDNPDVSVYIFGCGDVGTKAREALRSFNIIGFLDNDPGKQGTVVDGLPVLRPDQLTDRNARIVIALHNEEPSREVEEQCRRLGLRCVHWYDFHLPPSRPQTMRKAEEEEALHQGLDLWDEELSKNIYRRIVRFRGTGNPEDRPAVTVPQYFIEEVASSALRNVADIGAFSGDTLRRFLALRGDDFDGYHAFEPMPSLHPRLFQTAGDNPRIRIHPFALADFNGTGKFAGPTGGTRLTASGEELPVRRLDDILQDVRIGFIKMDIEGAEPLALRGAEQIIRGQHPVLAISVYHQLEHLWTIPRWIRKLDIGYRLILRHHSRSISETVCYALPT